MENNSTAFLIKIKRRHSLGGPSRSDFVQPELVGDGAGGGKMTIEKLSEILQYIQENTGIIGFTIAEYLPFDEYRLHKMFSKIVLFSE